MNMDDLSAKLDDFDHFYNDELKPLLESLETKRKEAYSTFIKVVIGVMVIVITIAILLKNIDKMVFVAVPAFLIVGYFYRKMAIFRAQAKHMIMPEICTRLGMTYHQKPRNNATQMFRTLSLIPSYDEKKLEDEVRGCIDDVDFNLFEAKLINVSRDSKGRTTRNTVFKGLLANFDFHKNFVGTTVVSGDLTALGNFLTGWAKGGDRVKLEDPEFESKFEVHSTDQVEARYLLTPSLMERILKFSNMANVKGLELAFHDRHLFMSIKRDKQYFEGGGYDLDDLKYIKENIKDITFIFDIINQLNLAQNTKI